jgi:hypothetical protein
LCTLHSSHFELNFLHRFYRDKKGWCLYYTFSLLTLRRICFSVVNSTICNTSYALLKILSPVYQGTSSFGQLTILSSIAKCPWKHGYGFLVLQWVGCFILAISNKFKCFGVQRSAYYGRFIGIFNSMNAPVFPHMQKWSLAIYSRRIILMHSSRLNTMSSSWSLFGLDFETDSFRVIHLKLPKTRL